MRRNTFFFLLLLLALPGIIAFALERRQVEIRPQIPEADRTAGDRVFLEHADVLSKAETDSFMVLVGNVVFTKGGMTMSCDSAHYVPETESMDAFGNVSMEQGDTLHIYADELNYDGLTEVAVLYADEGKKVIMNNRDVTLRTDIFVYDMRIDLGYYEVGGELTDPNNTLTSLQGEYAPSTKEANFYINVHLNSHNSRDTLDIYSDTLYYNTATHIAELTSPSRVINDRGTIFTTLGVYDTDSSITTLYHRSTVVTPQGQTITADTLFYDRRLAYGEGFGNMVLTDSAHHVEIRGDYGYYDQTIDSAFVTGRAMLVEYSKPDTLFLHGRYIQSFREFDSIAVPEDTLAGTAAGIRVDTTHTAVVFPRVRFYRTDLQGICDSMRFTERDTILRMFINPVVWNEQQQIFGNLIELKFNDSTIEKAILPDQGFAAQHIEGEHYNQLSGKIMTATFEAGEMRRLEIDGNVEIIMYPEESDSTFNKIVNAESSFLDAWFRGRTTERIKMWPATTGRATPLFLARPSIYYLPKFKWFEGIRPRDRDDIFTVPAEMEQLMSGRPVPVIEFAPRSRLRPSPLPEAGNDEDTEISPAES